MWKEAAVECDTVGRSHGDVNCDSLLVQLLRCRTAGRHEQHFLLFHKPLPTPTATPKSVVLPCWNAASQVKRSAFTGSLKCLCGHVVWPHVMGMLYKGRHRGREDRREPSELLRVIIWWLMAGGCQIRYDKLCQARITLSHFYSVYLSAFLSLTTLPLLNTYPTSLSVLVLVSFQTNFKGMSSKVLKQGGMTTARFSQPWACFLRIAAWLQMAISISMVG